MSTRRGSIYEVASVLTEFHPGDLRNRDGIAFAAQEFEQLLADSIKRRESDGFIYSLKNSVRRQVIARIQDFETVQDIISANRDVLPSNSIQDAIAAFADGRIKDLQHQTAEELAGLLKVCEWFEDGALENLLPKIFDVREWFEWKKQTESLNQLVPKPFCGRKKEFRELKEHLEDNRSKPITVFGIGGIGKTSLLASFLWNRVNPRLKDERLPFVWLDYYDPILKRSEDPSVLLYLASMQLVNQRLLEQEQEASRNRRDRLLDFVEQLEDRIEEDPEVRNAELDDNISEFCVLVSECFGKTPLLWVIDSLEELQLRRNQYTSELLEFCDRISTLQPTISFFLSSRSRITPREISNAHGEYKSIHLGKLDHKSATEMVTRLGGPEEYATAIAKAAKGMPLRLRMLTEQFNKEFDDGALNSGESANLTAFFESLSKFDSEQFVMRFIDHLHNEEVAQFLRFGLQLRKVDAELMLKIVEDLGYTNICSNLEESSLLLDSIASEIWTAESFEDGILIFRPELREELLPFLRGTKRFRKINQIAIDHYSAKDTIKDKAEMMYCMLLQGGRHNQFDEIWEDDDQFVSNIVRSFYDLPHRSQAYIASKTNIEALDVPPSVWDSVRLTTWEEEAAGRVKSLLKKDQAENALEVLKEREKRSQGSSLILLEAKVLSRLGRYSEAENILLDEIAKSHRFQVESQSTNFEVLSLLFWLQYEYTRSIRISGESSFVATFNEIKTRFTYRLGFWEQLALTHMQVVCLRAMGQDVSAIREKAIHLISKALDDRKKTNNANKRIVRRIAVEVAPNNIGLLARIISVYGIGPQTPVSTEELGTALASWSHFEPDLQLENTIGLAVPSEADFRDLRDIWSNWLLFKTEKDVSLGLHGLMTNHIEDIPTDVVQGIGSTLGFWNEYPRTQEDVERRQRLKESQRRKTNVRSVLRKSTIEEIEDYSKSELKLELVDIVDVNQSKSDIIRGFANWAEICSYSSKIVEHFNQNRSTRLNDAAFKRRWLPYTGSFFIGRQTFRNQIKKLLSPGAPAIMIVVGARGSGKSYSYEFLQQLDYENALAGFKLKRMCVEPGMAHEMTLQECVETLIESADVSISPTDFSDIDLNRRLYWKFARDFEKAVTSKPNIKKLIVIDGLDAPGLATEIIDFFQELISLLMSSNSVKLLFLGFPNAIPVGSSHLFERIAPESTATIEQISECIKDLYRTNYNTELSDTAAGKLAANAYVPETEIDRLEHINKNLDLLHKSN